MQPPLCGQQLLGGLQFRVPEGLEKTLTMAAEEVAVALSMAADRTGRLLHPPKETPRHLEVRLWHRGMLRHRPVVRRRQEPATSWWWLSRRRSQSQNEEGAYS